jgi:DoxX-like protein
MKMLKITYWVTTGLVSLIMLYSVIVYMTDPRIDAVFHHLGFPSYLRVELAVGKLIGIVLLLGPFSAWLKEWAYGCFVVVFISAVIAHTVSGDLVISRLIPVVILVIHLGSYISYRMLTAKKEIWQNAMNKHYEQGSEFQ